MHCMRCWILGGGTQRLFNLHEPSLLNKKGEDCICAFIKEDRMWSFLIKQNVLWHIDRRMVVNSRQIYTPNHSSIHHPSSLPHRQHTQTEHSICTRFHGVSSAWTNSYVCVVCNRRWRLQERKWTEPLGLHQGTRLGKPVCAWEQCLTVSL